MTEPELTPVRADPSEFLFIPSTLVESPLWTSKNCAQTRVADSGRGEGWLAIGNAGFALSTMPGLSLCFNSVKLRVPLV